MTTGRTYLSIGDVLTLLRREFPDVTISKIRFLESQGLVDPERTPSGYRKFYEHDVQRLRWVLRQQREHFLPLKVIKGRLEQESSPSRGGNGNDAAHSDEALVQGRRGGAAHPEPAGGGGTDTTTSEAEEGPQGAEPALVGARTGPERVAEGTSTGSPSTFHPSGPPAEPHVRPLTPAERRRGQLRDRRGQHAQTAPGGGDVPEPSATGSSPATTMATVHRLPQDAGATAGAEPGSVEATPAAAEEAAASFGGMSMTLDELAQACGLEPAQVGALESFGLITSRAIGGSAYFDEDALEVSKIAASFARHGVEPRHLRMHLLAAQREAGFIEQIVLPLFKQRNPASRQRAHETVSELSAMGQELRAVLLRRTIRDLLGG